MFVLWMTACPVLVMAMSDSLMFFYAVYFTDKMYATRLCQLSLDGHACDTDDDLMSEAKLQVMWNTGRMLREYYTNLHTSCTFSDTPQLFPQPTSIFSQHPLATPASISEATSLNISLRDRVPDSKGHFNIHHSFFRGTIQCKDDPNLVDVYVKFLKHYGKEAHSYLTSHHPPFTLQLLYCGEVVTRYMIVIMEDLHGEPIDPSLPDDISGIIQSQAEAALEVLHAGDFMHGDLRKPNIALQSDTWCVYFIDFDWADKQGKVKYPICLNPKIRWIRPAHLLAGHDIQKHDDWYLLRQELV
ncbi:hypothetical protein LXA43DRAFT_1068872 [Ganoderma leucocontextum]|nr:hypothetical protein LXA43DRAFT_1068872 [Ganoderma leucocontextum]